MFGFDPISLALIGGAIGGLTSKDPLKGAILGAGMGYGGGLLAAPGAAGASAAAQMEGAAGRLANPVGNATTAANLGTNIGSQQTAMLAAQEAPLTQTPGLLGQIKPVGEALQTANAAKSLMPQDRPVSIQPSPIMPTGGGAQGLSSMYQQMQQNAQAPLQLAEQQRRQRRYMWG